MSEERFILKVGRFGAYFYDDKLKKDVDLNEIKDMLNEWGSLNKIGKALEGYQR